MTINNLRMLSSLALLTAASLIPCATLAAQEVDFPDERRVLIWRDEGEHLVELEAGLSRRGFLGITMLDLTPELRRHFGVPADRGIMISRVVDESPAQLAGLQPADILTSVDGEPLPAGLHLSMSVAQAAEGDAIDLEYWREGRPAKVNVKLEVRERSQFDISPLIERRIHVRSPRMLELHQGLHGEIEVDDEWIEQVVGNVGERFTESTFVEQLEAMRRERSDLHEQLQQMEERLQELEAELEKLGRDDR
jgi:hypothetical protein